VCLKGQIAPEMQISKIMVKLHRGRMMKKLQAHSVAAVLRTFDKIYQQGSE
jgi:FixJ family two-component response regulator